METIFLVRLVPAWSANATARAVSKPEIIFTDPGIANYLTLGTTGPAATGGLLEHFVLSEICKQLTWANTPARLFHHRDRDQYEVDGVLERTTPARSSEPR